MEFIFDFAAQNEGLLKWAITMSHVLCNYTVYLGNGRRWAQCDCGSAVTTSVVLGLTISVPDLLCISCVAYMIKSSDNWLYFKSGVRVRRPHVLLQNTSTTHNYFVVCRNVVVGIEQGCSLGLDVSVSRRSRDVPYVSSRLVSEEFSNVSVSSRSRP